MLINTTTAGRGRIYLAAMLVTAAILLTIASSAHATFGVEAFDGQVSAGPSGEPLTQAGGHPYVVSNTVNFNHHLDTDPNDVFTGIGGGEVADESTRDIVVELPPGLIGNMTGIPKCTPAQLAGGGAANPAGVGTEPTCPIDSQIGVAKFRTNMDNPSHIIWSGTFPVYSILAPPNVPASFGLQVEGNPVILDASLRSDGDYGLNLTSDKIVQSVRLWGATVTFWGIPADPSHDEQRCDLGGFGFVTVCPESPGTPGGPHAAGLPPRALLTAPTECTLPGAGLEFRLRADTWEHPGSFQLASFLTHDAPYFPTPSSEWGVQAGIGGCDRVPFDPSIHVAPSSSAPDSPSGLGMLLSIPTEGLENPVGVAQSALRKLVVRLPEGVAVNPSAADGLGACTPAQIALHSLSEQACPESSKIGTVEVKTPLLEAPLEGSLYLASQGENPFGSLLAAYLVAKGSGVLVKIPGRIDADANTGRLTATFDDVPQSPIASTTVMLKDGPRAPLVIPATCGAGAVSSTLEGWNGKSVTQSTPTSVDCTPGLGGFSPSFTAGTINPQAGAFTPFTLTVSRQDGEQNLQGLSATLPPGLIGKLAGIPLCSDAQANAGTCPGASQIGTVTADAGAGPHPFYVQGKIFLTGKFNGGPFGEVVVLPAIAGPFNLGNVVVRGSIRVDPNTTQATVVSDPFPQILQGIPLRTRKVSVTLDRPGFMFNPTNCEPLTITGSISSAQGATANVSSHYQAVNCAALGFHPLFKVSTKAQTSKNNGAYLDVKVTPSAGQVNLGKVAVTLPKQLPSWLPTIQQACLAAVFNANPAACPAGSDIGVATATTPILANPVSGPVYLVSHGGAAFPDIVMVLQGEGVTVDLVGSINIKGQVTSSAFNSIPDVPISTFELNLPQGPHHALSSNLPAKAKGSFCGQALTMPTTLTGQNGAQIKQNTKIAVTGCPKTKAKKKAKKHPKKKGKK